MLTREIQVPTQMLILCTTDIVNFGSRHKPVKHVTTMSRGKRGGFTNCFIEESNRVERVEQIVRSKLVNRIFFILY